MLILALDTSGETCSVAITEGSRCRAEYRFRHERRLIERLPVAVQFVLADAGVEMADVEAFAVGLGPGSFTGVRVGVTMVKVWAMTTGKPVVGVSSLDAIAESYLVAGQARVVIAPTRKAESVAGFYGAWEAAAAPPAVVAHDALLAGARAFLGNSWDRALLLGEHAFAVWTTLADPDRAALNPVADSARACVVADLAFRLRLERGASDDADTLVPLYVTPPPTG